MIIQQSEGEILTQHQVVGQQLEEDVVTQHQDVIQQSEVEVDITRETQHQVTNQQ